MEEQDTLEMWISTDELKDAVFSLRIVNDLLERVRSDPFFWKWIVIILHNALQTLMVAVLYDWCKVGSSRWKKSRKILQKWKDLHNMTKRPKILSDKLEEVYMADFMEIYENLKAHRIDGITLDKPFEPTEKQEERIRDLIFWRNHFVHLLPATRLLNAWEYLRLMPTCVEFTEFLTQAPGLLRFGDACKEARESVSILKRQIESLRRKCFEKYPQLADIE